MQMSVDRIKEEAAAVVERYGARVTALYLFGSRAANRQSALSDIDLAILFAPGESDAFLELRFALYAAFSRALATNRIDLTVLNTLDNLFILDEIVRKGELIFDGQTDLRRDFEQKALHRALDFKQQRHRVMGI